MKVLDFLPHAASRAAGCVKPAVWWAVLFCFSVDLLAQAPDIAAIKKRGKDAADEFERVHRIKAPSNCEGKFDTYPEGFLLIQPTDLD
jgi:hypothetical protein